MMNDFYAMSAGDLWPIILGIILPPFISLVNRVKWSAGVKSGVMLIAVFITTTLGEVISGRLTQPHGLMSWVHSLFVVFLLTVTTYRHIWKPTGVAPRIEAATDREGDSESL